MDRLFGNKTLHEHTNVFYKFFNEYYLKNNSRPIIIVDGSGLTPCGEFHFLRAAVPAGGRTLTLYDEVHTTSTLNHPKSHLHFLKRLKELIPSGARPIIVTDAGFRNTWLKKVRDLGWDYAGQIRHQTHYKDVQENWQIKQQKKYRVRQNLAGKRIQCSVSLKHAKRGNETWLIVSSISNKDLSPIN